MGSARTFDQLLGGDPDIVTLAYWLGSYRGPYDADELLAIGGTLALQYDFEEQADCYGRAVPEEGWGDAFFPVAPVQLASRWSPLPRTVEVLGEPAAEAVKAGTGPAQMAALAWSASAVAAVASTPRQSASADEKRFAGLLAVAVMRAKERGRGILLVAKPGWSYGHVHDVSKETARLMTKAGFVLTTRRP